jgi:glycosyltransferase involved in cell wall biosynthesis
VIRRGRDRSSADAVGRSSPGAGGLRVAHLAHTTVAGGAEFALVRMLRVDPPWQPAVLLPAVDGAGAFADLPPTVPRSARGVRQPAGVSSGGRLLMLDAAARLIVQAVVTRVDRRFRSADILDANTARAAAYGALAARTSRLPFVVHLRDLVEPESLGRFGYEMMTRVALPRANGVVANSRATLDSARPFLRSGALTAVIPSAAGLVFGEPRAQRRPGPLRVGMLARIDPWKGQLLLLEAFASALRGTDAVLEFAGAPFFGHEPYERCLRDRTDELGLSDRVRFLGQVDDVHALLGGWDIAVQASTRVEPLGQNVLQYLAAGCAVVVADEGGPTEWVANERNGLRFAPRDAASLAAAIERLAGDPELRGRLGSAAAATEGLLDDEGVARAHARFYADLLAPVTAP